MDRFVSRTSNSVALGEMTREEGNALILQKQQQIYYQSVADYERQQRFAQALGAMGGVAQQTAVSQQNFEDQRNQNVANLIGGKKTYRATPNYWGGYDVRET